MIISSFDTYSTWPIQLVMQLRYHNSLLYVLKGILYHQNYFLLLNYGQKKLKEFLNCIREILISITLKVIHKKKKKQKSTALKA